MAPAFYIPGYEVQNPEASADKIVIAHDWHDEVVTVEHSIRFATGCNAELHLLDSDHRLNDQIETLCLLFAKLLNDRGAKI